MKIKNRASNIDRIADHHYNGQYVVPPTIGNRTSKVNTKKAIMDWKANGKSKPLK
jgi:hypothetical protein